MVLVAGLFANIGFAAEMKKVLLLETSIITSSAPQILQGLEQAGFVDQKNMTYSTIRVSATDDVTQLVAQVEEAAPDVVVANIETGNALDVLKDLSIPVITGMNVDRYVTAEGVPTANITGVYTVLPDMVYNSYKFLQKIAPLKQGQSVVYLDNPEFQLLSKDTVMAGLQRLGIPVKAVVDATVYEDWQQAILKYSDDPEVGWILRASPSKKRDGSRVNMVTELYLWQQENLKKPTVTYWDIAVQMGTLCAFGVDINESNAQTGRMAARVLQGEPIQSIKAEYPQKVSISLNRKTATKLGIVFSMDVLNLANVIYDDYEGKQVIRK
jgi:ABC-type uncharacterized transport system substrate-binding protein